jgi:low affinity Fe/Cu permease
VTSGWLGSRWGFGAAAVFVLVWALTGPIFHYSDTWQLIINSVTNIVTFLMVFLLQNTQNRDAKAINLKLDELIYSISTAKDQMIDIETLSDKELEDLSKRYEKIREEHLRRTERPGS